MKKGPIAPYCPQKKNQDKSGTNEAQHQSTQI